MSMYIQGKIIGVVDKQGKARKNEETGQIMQGNYFSVLALQVEGVGRDGLKEVKTIRANFFADNYASGLQNSYRSLEGQEVLMPVTIEVYNNGLSYNVSGLPLKPVLETFAPVRKSPAELVADSRAARGAPTLQAQTQTQAPVAKPATAQG